MILLRTLVIKMIIFYLVIALVNSTVYICFATFAYFTDESYTKKDFKRALFIAPEIGFCWIYLFLSFVDDLKDSIKKKNMYKR